jgi:hypothetical protein
MWDYSNAHFSVCRDMFSVNEKTLELIPFLWEKEIAIEISPFKSEAWRRGATSVHKVRSDIL